MFEYDSSDNSMSAPNSLINRQSIKSELSMVKSDDENSNHSPDGGSTKKQKVSFTPLSLELNKSKVRYVDSMQIF